MAKYKPLNIENGLIPKEWLNNPIMSYNDAEAEYQELQRKTAVAEQADLIVKENRRENESEEEVSRRFKETRDAKIAAGEDGELTEDEIYKLVDEAELQAGQGKSVAERTINRKSKEALEEYRKEQANKPKYVTRSPYSDLIEVDADGNRTVVEKGKERVDKGRKFTPKTLLNVDTLDTKTVYSEAEEADAYSEGYDQPAPRMTASEFARAKRRQGKTGAGITAPSKTPPPPPVDLKYDPKTQKLQMSNTGKYRVVPK